MEWTDIIFKAITYAAVFSAVSLCIGAIRNITNKNNSENIMDKKIYSRIYLGVAILLTVIYIIVAQFQSNVAGKTKVIMATIAILIDVFTYLMSFLYSNWKIKIENGELIYCNLLRKEKRISCSDISKVIKDEYGNLIIFDGEKEFIKLSVLDGYTALEENLKARNIKIKNMSDINHFVMSSTKLYYVLDIICIIVSTAFLVGCLHYKIWYGLIFFFAVLVADIFSFVGRFFNRIEVKGSVITWYRFLCKPKIMKFSDIKYIKRMEENNTEYIYLYSEDGSKIKICKTYKNAELFEEVIKRHKWKSRDK